MATCNHEADSDGPDAHTSSERRDATPVESPDMHLERARRYIRAALDLVTGDEAAELLDLDASASSPVLDDLRTTGQLIGFPTHNGAYLYPAFQFDTQRHKIYDVVRHANRRLYVNKDPYGAASWWLTPTEILDGNSPLDDLTYGILTRAAVDNIVAAQRSGM